MAIEVILMADVQGLGAEGAVVRVAEGYARNHLIPRKLAAPVTEATRRRLAKLQRDREAHRQDEVRAAQATADAMAKASVTIPVKVGEGEKMFGAVSSTTIAEALATQGFAVDKHKVVLDEPIRELGVYEVKVKVHPEVEVTIKVWVVEE